MTGENELPRNDPTNPAHRLADDLRLGRIPGYAADDVRAVLTTLAAPSTIQTGDDGVEPVALKRLHEFLTVNAGASGVVIDCDDVKTIAAEIAALASPPGTDSGPFSPKSEDTQPGASLTVVVPREPTPETLEPFARVLCSALNLDPDEPEAPHGEWPTWYGQCSPLAAAYRDMIAVAPSEGDS